MKVDIHTHILPPHLPDFQKKYGQPGFLQLEQTSDCCALMKVDGKLFREVKSNAWDPKVRLEECEKAGVDLQVLSTVPKLFSYWAEAKYADELSRYLNDHIAGVVSEFPKNFLGLATLPLQDLDLSLKELNRIMKIPGMVGVEIGTHLNGKNLEDSYFDEFYAEAEKLGAAIFVHPWDMLGKERMPKYWLPWLVGMPAETSLAICSMLFGGVFQKFPKLRVCFAHGGGAFPGTLGRIEHAFEVRPDLCAVDTKRSPKSQCHQFYVDSLVHDPNMLEHLISIFGSQRVALGSDYPFPLGEHHPGRLIESLSLNEQDRENLLCSSAMRWLNRSSEDFV